MATEPIEKLRNVYITIHEGVVEHTCANSPEEAIDNLDLYPWTYPDDWIDWADPNGVLVPSRQEAIEQVLNNYKRDPDYILIEVTRQGALSIFN